MAMRFTNKPRSRPVKIADASASCKGLASRSCASPALRSCATNPRSPGRSPHSSIRNLVKSRLVCPRLPSARLNTPSLCIAALGASENRSNMLTPSHTMALSSARLGASLLTMRPCLGFVVIYVRVAAPLALGLQAGDVSLDLAQALLQSANGSVELFVQHPAERVLSRVVKASLLAPPPQRGGHVAYAFRRMAHELG